MKYLVKYEFECNPYEIITDFLNEEDYDTKKISTGNSDDKNRPLMKMDLITFDKKEEAVAFMAYYSQNCCHTMLKANRSYESALKNEDVVSWLTIQDYHLYERLYLEEIE